MNQVANHPEENSLKDSPFYRQMKKSEASIQWWVIALFTLVSSLAIWEEPYTAEGYFFTLLKSFLNIIVLWYTNRFLFFWSLKKFPGEENNRRRLFITLGLSLFISIAFYSSNSIYFSNFGIRDLTFLECFFFMKKVLMSMIVLGYMVIAVYEGLVLFVKWSDSQVKAETYRKEGLEAQFQNLKNQLNPHFMFNSFNTLSTIIEEDPEKASRFVQELSDVYRYVLNSQKSDWVMLEEELAIINSYLFLLRMRHEDNLTVDLRVGQEVRKTFVPPLALQMLIENAIKHNEISTSFPLKIEIYNEGDYLVVSNPIQERRVVERSTGIGLSNIRNRYDYLTGKNIVVDRESGKFTVKIPLVQLSSK